MAEVRNQHILWGLTASVAAIRAPLLASKLVPIGDVTAVITERARHFVDELPEEVTVYSDKDEWAQWNALGDPVLHIELRRWADVFVIAPLTADCLAKLAGGICDNLLLSVARAWDFSKPFIVAPAMNTLMWEHPVTQTHLDLLRTWGIEVVDPVSKKLACEDVGIGALAPPDAITDAVAAALSARAASN
jgi:phosphopantothenoylcysteine decarboxylase